MNEKLVQSLLRSCLFRLIFSFAFAAIAFVVVFGFGVLLALIPDRYLEPELKAFLQVGSLLCCGGLLVIGVFVWVLTNNSRIYAQFDAAFLPFGLTRSRYLLAGLRYQGQYRGRSLNVYYYVSGGRYLRVPNLQIYVSGNFRTRLALGDKNVLTQLASSVFKQNLIQVNEPAYEGLIINTIDEAWARQLLNDPAARDLILHLVGKETPGVRGLVFGPESLYLNLRHFSLALITPEAVRGWIEALLNLAALAEGLPPPTQTAQASEWERAGQFNRNRFLLPAILIVAAIVIVVVGIMGGCLLLLLLTGQL